MNALETVSREKLLLLSEISEKDLPWDIHSKAKSRLIDILQNLGYEAYARRLNDCSNLLEFKYITSELGEMTLKLHSARFCRVRVCPVCQWRKSLMWRARAFKHFPRILEDFPGHRFVFLTLTVKNCPVQDLKKMIISMNQGWKRMSERKIFPADGFIRSLEVTRSKDGTAHPHFHCLLMVKPSYFTHGYIKQADWTDLWRDCMRLDYTPMVNVKAVKTLKRPDQLQMDKAFSGGICEVLKYCVKEADMMADPDWLDQYINQIHNVRSISLGGVIKQYMSEDDPEDLIHSELDDDLTVEIPDTAASLYFAWDNHIKQYRQKIVSN
jgi:plasmid rolling circle replication initiator protein Rep